MSTCTTEEENNVLLVQSLRKRNWRLEKILIMTGVVIHNGQPAGRPAEDQRLPATPRIGPHLFVAQSAYLIGQLFAISLALNVDYIGLVMSAAIDNRPELTSTHSPLNPPTADLTFIPHCLLSFTLTFDLSPFFHRRHFLPTHCKSQLHSFSCCLCFHSFPPPLGTVSETPWNQRTFIVTS